MDQYEEIGSCDNCGGEIFETDEFKIVDDDTLLCPECYEEYTLREFGKTPFEMDEE